MNRFKEEFEKIIKESGLEATDKNLWKVFIDNSGEKEIVAVFEAVKESEEDLIFLTENLKEKQKNKTNDKIINKLRN